MTGQATALATPMCRGLVTPRHEPAGMPLPPAVPKRRRTLGEKRLAPPLPRPHRQQATATAAGETPNGAEETPTPAERATATTAGETRSVVEETLTPDHGEKPTPDGGRRLDETAETLTGSATATANGSANGSASASENGSASPGGQARQNGNENHSFRGRDHPPPARVR